MMRLEKQRDKAAKRLARKAESKAKQGSDLDALIEYPTESETEPKAEEPTL